MATIEHPGTGSDGRKYVVYEVRSSIRTTDLASKTHEEVAGLPMYRTANGRRLNKIGDSVFQTPEGDLTITLDAE